MSESPETILATPQPKGLGDKDPVHIPNFLSGLPFYRLMAQQEESLREMNQVIYSHIYEPDYETLSITEQAERNRQILLWEIHKGITIPTKYRSQNDYSKTPTSVLLSETLDEVQTKSLQGDMLFPLAQQIKDVSRENVVIFGGLIYSQSLIDDGSDGTIVGLIKRELASEGFQEPGIRRPGALRRNVKGAIHVLPYGIPNKIPGKENQTLLMLADDMLSLVDYLGSSDVMDYPRFILNGTHKEMGRVGQKYFGAQVKRAADLSLFTSDTGAALAGRYQRKDEDFVAVFISGSDLKNGRDKLVSLRGKMSRFLGNDESNQRLKEIRIDAIESIANQQNFVQMYQKSI